MDEAAGASRREPPSETRLEVVDPRHPDARYAVSSYFDELDERFPGGFDPGDALETDADALAPPAGAFVVARTAGRTIACGGVQRVDDQTAEIKRMWVHKDWRVRGLGRLMLSHLEAIAEELGHNRVVLDTNAVLVEAIAMYESSGYESTEPYNDNPYAMCWFVKQL